VTVDDGVDVRPRLVDLAVDEALLVGAAPLRIDGLLSRSYSMMSSAVTVAGATERDIR
jgi:hypothetical protein